MSIKKLDAKALGDWVDSIVGQNKVIGVQMRNGAYSFLPLTKAENLALDYDVTVRSPKHFLQPPVETLLTFKADEGYSAVIDEEPFVLLGVHPYDLKGITQMDRIFAEGNCDDNYIRRRENVTIVALDPEKASETVFAGAVGAASMSEGYDVLLTKVGDDYLVDAATDKGEKLIEGIGAADASDEDVAARAQVQKDNETKLNTADLKAETSTWADLLKKGYDSKIWEERAEKCFSCGSCTLVCPTCYCFDVKEDVEWSLTEGNRSRTWDSCMLKTFAKVAGGHDFRADAAARYRHRYLRKGAYVPGKLDGEIACVGCGRCISACVAKIANPVEIFNGLQEEA